MLGRVFHEPPYPQWLMLNLGLKYNQSSENGIGQFVNQVISYVNALEQ